MSSALYLSLIIVAIAVIAVVLLQGRGSGLSGGIFANNTSIYGSRRGIEKTLFNITIGLIVLFILLDLAAVLYA
ncbi:MAG: preprotein translocase subunit SecG [Ardenticatenales bacterium]|nr:preprotein translocase subunit SecG [Ardenticatenales bacterium]